MHRHYLLTQLHRHIASPKIPSNFIIDTGNTHIDREILDLALPYLHEPSRETNSSLLFGEFVNDELVSGIRYWTTDGSIAIGTYNAKGRLNGQNCMLYFADTQVYTFGAYIDGDLINGKVYYINQNYIETGPRNSNLLLEGKSCTQNTASGSLIRGEFVAGQCITGSETSHHGIITTIFVKGLPINFLPLPTTIEEEQVYQQISELTKPYLTQIFSLRNHDLYLGNIHSGERFRGVKRFENGNIAIGTYNAEGLLNGPNCMFFFHEKRIYAFGDTINGNLVSGTAHFLDKYIEIGPRNELLRLNGPDCKQVTNTATYSGVFNDGTFISGTISDINGVITAIKPNEGHGEILFLSTKLNSPLEKEAFLRISEAAKRYLSMEYQQYGSDHYFGVFNTEGRMVEGLSIHKDGIVIGTYNSKKELEGPNCLIYFKKTQTFTEGIARKGIIVDGDVLFLQTNTIEIGKRNKERTLHGPECKRITREGDIYTGYANNGVFISGAVKFANGTQQLIAPSSSTNFISSQKEIEFYTTIYSKPSDIFAETEILPLDIGPSACKNREELNDLRIGMMSTFGLLLFGVLAYFVLKRLLTAQIYTNINLDGENIGRREKRAINRKIGAVDEKGNQYHPLLMVTKPLPKMAFTLLNEELKSKISGLELIPPVGPVKYLIQVVATDVKVTIGDQKIWLTESETNKLARSIIHHINNGKDFRELFKPDVFCKLLPNNAYAQVSDSISCLEKLSESYSRHSLRISTKSEPLRKLSTTFNAQFSKLIYPSSGAQQLHTRLEKMAMSSPVPDLTNEIEGLRRRFQTLTSSDQTTLWQDTLRYFDIGTPIHQILD